MPVVGGRRHGGGSRVRVNARQLCWERDLAIHVEGG